MATDLIDDPVVAARFGTPDFVPKGYEYIDDELVEMAEMGYRASWVSGEVYFALRSYLSRQPIGVASTAEASFRCFPGRPRLVRKPDVAVVLCDPATFAPPDPHCLLVPAVVVEVVSPNERVYELSAKIADYLAAGTRLVWEINPEGRTVTIRRPNRVITQLVEPADLTGEDILPGFSVPLAAFLPRLPPA